jgi:hypothetical protein
VPAINRDASPLPHILPVYCADPSQETPIPLLKERREFNEFVCDPLRAAVLPQTGVSQRETFDLGGPRCSLRTGLRRLEWLCSYPISALERVTGTPLAITCNVAVVAVALSLGAKVGFDNTKWQVISNTSLAYIQATMWFLTVYADQKQFRLAATDLSRDTQSLQNLLRYLESTGCAVASTTLAEVEAYQAPYVFTEHWQRARENHSVLQGAKACVLGLNAGLMRGIAPVSQVVGTATFSLTGLGVLIGLLASQPLFNDTATWNFWANYVPQNITSVLVDLLRYTQKQSQHQQFCQRHISREIHRLLEKMTLGACTVGETPPQQV